MSTDTSEGRSESENVDTYAASGASVPKALDSGLMWVPVGFRPSKIICQGMILYSSQHFNMLSKLPCGSSVVTMLNNLTYSCKVKIKI